MMFADKYDSFKCICNYNVLEERNHFYNLHLSYV